MCEVYNITREQVDNILNIDENYLNDFKAKEIKPSKLSETVSAFANAAGGDIYIGINEDKENNLKIWRGFNTQEEANDIIHTLFQSHPMGNHIKFEFLCSDESEGLVLHISIQKVKDIVKSSSGDIYVRVNAGKQKIDTEEKLQRLKLDKGINTFENELVEINLESITNSTAIINFILNVIPLGEPIKYLENQELISNKKAKVSGILLFADEPAIYLPKRCSIKILRYKTSTDDIGREFLEGNPITIEGDTYNLIYSAVNKTKELIENIRKLGKAGLEIIQYPEETLHEIVTNAVLHRDYSITTDIQIRIFDNRIEVESPGKLPGHVTVSNILDTQSARNPTLVRLINKFPNPPNKDVGEGLNTAFRAMSLLRLRLPEIIEKENSVNVIIRHERLGSPEELVMDYLQENAEITNSIARDITGIKSENTMKNVFLRLKKRGMIEQVPDKRGSASAWRLTRKNSNLPLFEV